MQMAVVKEETMQMKEKYGDARRTEITMSAEEFNPEDFYPDEDVVVTISHLGYIKRTPLTEYRTQARGGVGMKGAAKRDADFIEHIYVANMHSTLLLFTESAKCFWLKVYEIPEGSRSSKGRAIQNVLNLTAEDRIKAYLNVRNLKDEEYINNNYVVLCTKNGVIKKTTLEAYSRPRANGVIALTIREGDELLDVALTSGSSQLFIAGKEGRCVRFEESDVRPMGRTAAGVKGINLDSESNEVIGLLSYEPQAEDAADHSILVVSDHGYGKRSDFEEYRKTSRGSKGVKTLNITDKTGELIAIKNVTDNDDLMIITRSGLTIRMAVSDIRIAGRATQGVRLINIKDGDSIAAVSVVAKSDDEDEVTEAPAEQPVDGVSDGQGTPETSETPENEA